MGNRFGMELKTAIKALGRSIWADFKSATILYFMPLVLIYKWFKFVVRTNARGKTNG
jgi:hypothetical protein